MTIGITLLILFSALIHSIWNIQLKKSIDPYKFLLSIATFAWLLFTPYSIFKLFTSTISPETFIFVIFSIIMGFQ